MEIWVESIYKNYQVSNYGRFKRGDVIKTQKVSQGYSVVKVRIDGYRYDKHLHRIVAYAFLENPTNRKQVNHKNGNKLDNRVENLEWCTQEENNDHAIKNNLIKTVKVRCVETNETYISITEAAKVIKRDRKTFMEALDHPIRTCAGYHWVRVNKESL